MRADQEAAAVGSGVGAGGRLGVVVRQWRIRCVGDQHPGNRRRAIQRRVVVVEPEHQIRRALRLVERADDVVAGHDEQRVERVGRRYQPEVGQGGRALAQIEPGRLRRVTVEDHDRLVAILALGHVQPPVFAHRQRRGGERRDAGRDRVGGLGHVVERDARDGLLAQVLNEQPVTTERIVGRAFQLAADRLGAGRERRALANAERIANLLRVGVQQ